MPADLALIFAYHFPPENAIGALRPYRFYKYLSRSGYRCHVFSAAPVDQLPELDAEYIADPFVTKARQGTGWQVERALRRFLLPGMVGSQWAVQAYRAALRFMAKNPEYRFTAFSTFPPVGTHLAGYWLSRRRKIRWIADYRDPLGDNPVYDHINPFTKNVYRKLERILVRSADFTIANTDSAQEKLKRAHPDRADRIGLIWNGFDPEERLLPLPVRSPNRKIVAHVGELYGGRSVTPILESLRRLIDSRQLSANQFQVLLAGPVVDGSVPNSEFMAVAEKEGWVKLDGERLPQSAAHRIIQTAHALLLIQPQTALQVPGKLFEYLQIGRPILAFVPHNSPVERILEKSGVPYQCLYTSAGQKEVDDTVLRFVQLNGVQERPSEWFESQFNAQTHAEKVAGLIEMVNRKTSS